MLIYFAIGFMIIGLSAIGRAIYRAKNPTKSDDPSIKLYYSEYTENVYAVGIAALIIGAILIGITRLF